MTRSFNDAADALTRAFKDIAGVVSVYLFGSHAMGRAHRDSDIDIAVLLDWERHRDRANRFEVRLRLSSLVASVTGSHAVDVVILNDVPPPLARAVVTTGRRLYCADDEVDHAFVRQVLLRAADLEPFLRRVRQVKLAAIAR